MTSALVMGLRAAQALAEVDRLVRRGADVNAVTAAGETPLNLARRAKKRGAATRATPLPGPLEP